MLPRSRCVPLTILGVVVSLALLGAAATALSRAVQSSPRSSGLLLLIGTALLIGGLLGAAAMHAARRMSLFAEPKRRRPQQRTTITGAAVPRILPPERRALPSGSPIGAGLTARAAAPSRAPAGDASMTLLLAAGGKRGSTGPMALEPGADVDRCEVAVARRRNRAWFYARRPESDAPIVASPEFALRRRHPLALTPEAVAALEALTEGLKRLGWSFTGQESAWFGRQFVRPKESDRAPGGAAATRRPG